MSHFYWCDIEDLISGERILKTEEKCPKFQG